MSQLPRSASRSFRPSRSVWQQSRSISVRETRIRQSQLEQQREQMQGQNAKIIYQVKNTKLTLLQRAKASFVSSLEHGDFALATQHLELLKNDLDILTTHECIEFLKLVVKFDKNATNVSLGLALVLELLKRPDAPPPSTAVIYGVLQGLIRFQDGAKMELLLDRLIKSHVELNESILRLVLKYYSLNGPIQTTERVFHYFYRTLGMVASEQVFGLLIDAYGHAGQPWKALQVLREVEDADLELSPVLLARALRAFGNNGDAKGLEVILQLAATRGTQKTPFYYDTLLNAYRKIGQPQKDSIMMEFFARQGLMDEASQILATFVATRADVDVVMFNTILHGYRKLGKVDEVEYYYQLMLNCGVAPIPDTYNILMSLYGLDLKDQRKAEGIYQAMVGAGHIPDRYQIGTMIAVAVRNGDYDGARKWYGELQIRGMVPSASILHTMMQLAVKEKRQDCLSTGSLYYRLACELRCVNDSLVRQYAILQIVAGKPLVEILEWMALEWKTHLVKPTVKTCYVLADAVLCPSSIVRRHVLSEAVHDNQVEPGLPTVKGKAQFQLLLDVVEKEKGASFSAASKSWFQLALSRLD
ncbi:hypothetical protein HDU91_006236 [Kappamyces sp. JEL0680]|nr:hypothetical protein HDU91_006236 [Kappamyces sp. JEL0680]